MFQGDVGQLSGVTLHLYFQMDVRHRSNGAVLSIGSDDELGSNRVSGFGVCFDI
jgi:hypothetical protein